MTMDVQIKIRFLEDILHLPLKQNNICGECDHKEASIGWTHTLTYCVFRLYMVTAIIIHSIVVRQFCNF